MKEGENMSRINRTSSIRSSRVRESYVNRLNQAQGISCVEPTERTRPLENQSDNPNETTLLSFDHYYKKIRELKREFKEFYHHEQELLEAIKKLDTNKTKIVCHTNDLVEKYNQALLALKDFDRVAGTEHVQNVRDVYDCFAEDLAEIGVTEREDYLLSFHPDTFIQFIEDDRDNFTQLMLSFKQMILQEYRSLFGIRLDRRKTNGYDKLPFNVKGLMIEERS